eukprot:g5066.t1
MFKKTSVKDTVRTAKRDIQKNSRDVERELTALKREEQKLILQIKQATKQGNTANARVLAKSLIRLRGQITKLTEGSAQLKGISTQMTTAGATHTVGTAMKNASTAMKAVSKATDAQKMQQTLQSFTKENEKMSLAQEFMDDAVESALDTDGIEDEADDVMNQVLDEIGIEFNSKLSGSHAPATKVQARRARVANESAEEEDELLKRLGVL